MQTEAQAALEKFAPVAREFCEFIDGATTMDRNEFFSLLPIRLARICEAGASLPAVRLASADSEDPEIEFELECASDPAPLKKWSHLQPSLSKIFGEADGYWVLFSSTVDDAPVRGSISDDLADIYLDLQKNLRKLTAGSSPNETCLEAWILFHGHWYRHAIDALKYSIALLNLP
jgi:Domain of unknown function (DUF5063)